MANVCVMEGGTGNGADWDNALDDLPASMNRDDTYLVADGNYSAKTFGDSGATVCTIKKATPTNEAAGIAGWQDAYGDGEALFDETFVFTEGYYNIDGQYRGANWKSGYGIRVKANSAGTVLCDIAANVTNLNFDYVDFEHRGHPGGTTGTFTDDNGLKAVAGGNDQFTLTRCAMHDMFKTPFHIWDVNNFTLEYCWVARNYRGGGAGEYSEMVSGVGDDYHLYRYNLIEDIVGTAIWGIVNGSGVCYDWEIYGNVIWWTTYPQYGGVAAEDTGLSDGVISVEPSLVLTSNWQVHNNTIYRSRGNRSGFIMQVAGGGQENYCRNNLWYQCSRTGHFPGPGYKIMSHSLYDNTTDRDGDDDNVQIVTTDPFTDSANFDFSLSGPTNTGYTLASPYDEDLEGNMRGNGAWDRGAFEYNEGVTIESLAGSSDAESSVSASVIRARLLEGSVSGNSEVESDMNVVYGVKPSRHFVVYS